MSEVSPAFWVLILVGIESYRCQRRTAGLQALAAVLAVMLVYGIWMHAMGFASPFLGDQTWYMVPAFAFFISGFIVFPGLEDEIWLVDGQVVKAAGFVFPWLGQIYRFPIAYGIHTLMIDQVEWLGGKKYRVCTTCRVFFNPTAKDLVRIGQLGNAWPEQLTSILRCQLAAQMPRYTLEPGPVGYYPEWGYELSHGFSIHETGVAPAFVVWEEVPDTQEASSAEERPRAVFQGVPAL